MAKAKGPAYQVIYAAIRKKINKGVYRKDVAIPSENELAAKYEVSRMTARKSVDMLVAEGYLMRHKGKGTFITGRRNLVKEELSLTARLAARDRRVYNEVRSLELIEEFPEALRTPEPELADNQPQGLEALEGVIAAADAPDAKERAQGPYCWRLERLRFVDDLPAILEYAYIPQDFAPELSAEGARGSLVELLSLNGDPGSLELSCQAALLEKKKVAKALKLKQGELLLKVQGTLSFMDGTVALYSESWQNTQVLPFCLTLLK